MRANVSIRTQLTAFIGLFVVLVIAVAVAATVGVAAVGRDAAVIKDRWLEGTRVLNELNRHVSEFRLAETDRALTSDARAAADAETKASAERQAVEATFKDYVGIVGEEVSRGELDEFRSLWDDYVLVHDAWIRADAYRHVGNVARSNSSLHWRYKVVSKSIDALRGTNYQAADLQSVAARRLADDSRFIVSGACALAVLLAALVSWKIRSRITHPLSSITASLSRLAAGDLDVRLPEIDRNDEIGAMAKAFEVFRRNAAELEKAHAATRTAQEQAHVLARHDALTGLPNRRVFAVELSTALDRASAGEAGYAVLLIDLDRFKPVNDVQGHAAGDHVLCEVARRLERIPARRKTVARLGGDEFAIIAEADADPHALRREAVEVSDWILGAVKEPIQVGDVWIQVGASIGIALCPDNGRAAEDIIHAADLAMYRAKKEGRDTYRFFEQGMDEELRAQSALEESLRLALKNHEIRPYYQPLIGLDQERVCGFEVLARWSHPVHGFIPPDRFIPIAERLGLIEEMSASVLRQACRDARDWGQDVRLAFNVSPLQLVDPLFATRILAILSEEDFKPSRLELEITESALVGDIVLARETLASLQSLGITVSLDDFGTGYSSLYHLRNLKFDKLKIDRSFVQSMQTNAESAKIVDAVLGLAKSLGMPVVAEGIEDRTALRHLTQRGCEYGQGFLFSQAVAAAGAKALLQGQELRKIA